MYQCQGAQSRWPIRANARPPRTSRRDTWWDADAGGQVCPAMATPCGGAGATRSPAAPCWRCEANTTTRRWRANNASQTSDRSGGRWHSSPWPSCHRCSVLPWTASSLLSAAAIFAIYAAINLVWMLVLGTAGIFSLATLAIVGAAAYGSAWLSIEHALPWWGMIPVGTVIGLVFGIVIAVPAIRLEGFYYALLTLGLVELCRVFSGPVQGASGRRPAVCLVPTATSRLTGARRGAGAGLLRQFRRHVAGAGALSTGQRPTAGPPAACRTREAGSLRRSDRHRLPASPYPGVPDLVGGAWRESAASMRRTSRARRRRCSPWTT